MGWHTLVSDDFEDNNLTDWTVESPWTTQSGGLNGSSYCACCVQGTNDKFIKRSFTAYGRVRVTFRTKPGSTSNRWGYFTLASGATVGPQLVIIAGNFSLNANTIASYTGGTEYQIVIDANCATDKSTITINGTLYDNGGAGYSFANGLTTIDQFTINRYSPAGSSNILVDDVLIEYFVDEPTTVAAEAAAEAFAATPHDEAGSIPTAESLAEAITILGATTSPAAAVAEASAEAVAPAGSGTTVNAAVGEATGEAVTPTGIAAGIAVATAEATAEAMVVSLPGGGPSLRRTYPAMVRAYPPLCRAA